MAGALDLMEESARNHEGSVATMLINWLPGLVGEPRYEAVHRRVFGNIPAPRGSPSHRLRSPQRDSSPSRAERHESASSSRGTSAVAPNASETCHSPAAVSPSRSPLAERTRSYYHELMTRRHEPRKPARVAEPVQVYLDRPDRERLERLATALDATKSDVLRRALAALESQVRRPASRPREPVSLPTFKGKGLQPGVDLDDSASLLDLMQADDAPR